MDFINSRIQNLWIWDNNNLKGHSEKNNRFEKKAGKILEIKTSKSKKYNIF